MVLPLDFAVTWDITQQIFHICFEIIEERVGLVEEYFEVVHCGLEVEVVGVGVGFGVDEREEVEGGGCGLDLGEGQVLLLWDQGVPFLEFSKDEVEGCIGVGEDGSQGEFHIFGCGAEPAVAGIQEAHQLIDLKHILFCKLLPCFIVGFTAIYIVLFDSVQNIDKSSLQPGSNSKFCQFRRSHVIFPVLVKGIFEEIVFKNLPGSYFLSGSMRRKRLLIGEMMGKKIISDLNFVF